MRLDIADRAVTQAAEAHRIVSRKYDGGLATVVELLDASATETAARLRQAAARHEVIGAAADRRLARALDLTVLTTLDQ
jgi:outer membrane protein TolC